MRADNIRPYIPSIEFVHFNETPSIPLSTGVTVSPDTSVAQDAIYPTSIIESTIGEYTFSSTGRYRVDDCNQITHNN